jgi:hypothetical protein
LRKVWEGGDQTLSKKEETENHLCCQIGSWQKELEGYLIGYLTDVNVEIKNLLVCKERFKMGLSKLSVWFRFENCGPFPNLRNVEGFDWVKVWDCTGNLIAAKTVPLGPQAHVEIEIPPGCYIVQGHVCGERTDPPINDYTNKAMVSVGCDEVKCVNLMVPHAKRCGLEIAHPLVAGALSRDMNPRDIQTALGVIMLGIGIQREELVYEIDQHIESLAQIAEAKVVRDQYIKTKEMLMKTAIPIIFPRK